MNLFDDLEPEVKKKLADGIDELIKLQVDTTSLNDQYFRGMANGMVCVKSCITGEEPKFFEAETTKVKSEPFDFDGGEL